METHLIQKALTNLEKATGIKGGWQDALLPDIDAQIKLTLPNATIDLNIEIKKELRSHQLPAIIDDAKKHYPLLIIANSIFPKIKEELRANKIAYLEANGNVYMPYNNILVWIDAQKSLPNDKEKVNRALTKTGVKVIMQALLNPVYINLSYRDMAAIAGVSLGNINYVLNGLKEMGFLVNQNAKTYKIINKPELLNKFSVAYQERLKPTLKIGNFSFLNSNDFGNWQNISLQNGSVWGGEPAADILTNHLRPEILTLYTNEARNDLLKNYRLVPDNNGKVQVFTKFWEDVNTKYSITPPLLTYADLVVKEDKRLQETAQLIYEKDIKPNI